MEVDVALVTAVDEEDEPEVWVIRFEVGVALELVHTCQQFLGTVNLARKLTRERTAL
jgi:hypothetical protein